MKSERKFFSNTIIIISKTILPPILNSFWFSKNQIVDEASIGKGTIFADDAVRINTNEFTLIIIHNQLQFTIFEEKGLEILKRIVTVLDSDIFSAVGINFEWHVYPLEVKNKDATKELFFNENTPAFKMFNSDDAYFGGYISKDFHLGRMKLDIKPKNHFDSNKKYEFIAFSFNYHHDIGEQNILGKIINDWSIYFEDSEKIVREITA